MTEKLILVVVHEDFRIYKGPYSYVVGSIWEKKDGTKYLPEWTRTYHATLEAAMENLSTRIFERKLEKRAEDGKTDFLSLSSLIKEHKDDIKELFWL